jgi:hypothetical protein
MNDWWQLQLVKTILLLASGAAVRRCAPHDERLIS